MIHWFVNYLAWGLQLTKTRTPLFWEFSVDVWTAWVVGVIALGIGLTSYLARTSEYDAGDLGGMALMTGAVAVFGPMLLTTAIALVLLVVTALPVVAVIGPAFVVGRLVGNRDFMKAWMTAKLENKELPKRGYKKKSHIDIPSF